MDSERIVEEFRRYFSVVPARTPDLRACAYRVRYAVYAEELGWEDRSRFADGQERDEYDDNALICLLQHRESGVFAGCVRVVLGEPDPARAFPFETALRHAGLSLAGLPVEPAWRATAGEISRVAVISRFRRRQHEQGRPDTTLEDSPPAAPERRVFPHIAMGLYLGAAAMGLSHGLERVFAIMEPRLARRLRTYGIAFEAVGEPIEHHGLRVPYCLVREGFETALSPPIRALLARIRTDLAG